MGVKIRDFSESKKDEMLIVCRRVEYGGYGSDIDPRINTSLSRLHHDMIADKEMLARNIIDIFAKVRRIEVNYESKFNAIRWDAEYCNASLESFRDLINEDTDEPIEADALAAVASQRYSEFLLSQCYDEDGTYNRANINSLMHSTTGDVSLFSFRCDALTAVLEKMVLYERDEDLEWFLGAGVTKQYAINNGYCVDDNYYYVPTDMFLLVMDRFGQRGQELINENYDLLLRGTTILNEGGRRDELTWEEWEQFHFMNRMMQTHGIMADYVGAMGSYDQIYTYRISPFEGELVIKIEPDDFPVIDIEFTKNAASGKRFVNLILLDPYGYNHTCDYNSSKRIYTATAHPWDKDMKDEIVGEYGENMRRLRSELSADIIEEIEGSHDSVIGMIIEGYGSAGVGCVPVIGNIYSFGKTTFDISTQAVEQNNELRAAEGYLSDFGDESTSLDQELFGIIRHHDAYGSGGIRVSNRVPDNHVNIPNTYTLIYDPVTANNNLEIYNAAREAKGLNRVENIDVIMSDPQLNADFMRYIDGLAASEKG